MRPDGIERCMLELRPGAHAEYVPSSSLVPESSLVSQVLVRVLKTASKPRPAKGHGHTCINHVQH